MGLSSSLYRWYPRMLVWAGQRYVFALLVIIAIIACQWIIDPFFGRHFIATFLVLGTMLAAWYGGFAPAALVGILGLLSVGYLFPIPSDGSIAGLILYFLIVFGMGLVGSGIMKARHAAKLEFEKLRATLSSIGEAVIVTDRERRVVSFNEGAQRLTGRTEADSVGKLIDDVLRIQTAAGREPVELFGKSDQALHALKQSSYLIQRRPTEAVPVELTVSPIRLLGRQAEGDVFVLRDITERWNAEELLRSSERRFRHMADAAPVYIWTCNTDRNAYWFNRPWLQFVGCELEKADRIDFYKNVHPNDLPSFSTVFEEAFDAKKSFTREFRLRRRDGEYRWLLDRGVPNWESGEFVGYIGSCVDISDQKFTERALRESNVRFSQLANNIAQLAWMADDQSRINWYNERWVQATGTTQEQMNTLGWRCVLHPDESERVLAGMNECFSKGEVWSDTFQLRTANGSYRWYLCYAIPIRDTEANLVQWFGTCTDITGEKENSEALQNLAAQLSESDRLKNEFLATLAHELRNPLAPIKNAVQLLEMMQVDDEVVELRSTMARQVEQLIRLIDDLLDVSRISRGKIVLRREITDITTIVESAVEASKSLIEENCQTLTLQIPTRKVYANVDPARIAQVISNLLNNASKYSHPGCRIDFRLDVIDQQVVIEIKDNGIGIEADQLAHIFQMFTQVDNSLERGSTGLGIGLALVKNLVELHGGHVAAHSDGLGKGSVFHVTLPLVINAMPEERSPEPILQCDRVLRVLVVEDQAALRLMLTKLITKMGHQVDAVESADSAIEFLRTASPEVLFSDISMPGMSGYELAQKLRQCDRTRQLYLVAMTGYGQETDRQRAFEAGFDEHLVKPVDVHKLRAIFAQLESVNREVGLES